MKRTRYDEIDGTTIEEFYCDGTLVVYVDNFLSYRTFEQVCVGLRQYDQLGYLANSADYKE